MSSEYKMYKTGYRTISDFGPNRYSAVDNPLSYCLGSNMDQRFLHGGASDTYAGQNTKGCQAYLSEYCAEKWDGFCEMASLNTTKIYPNHLEDANCRFGGCLTGMMAGDVLVRNTAAKKYLVSMDGCVKKQEPFDPTVATSPLVSYWVRGTDSNENCSGGGCLTQYGKCMPKYSVDPATVDSDVVMDKLIAKPKIAMDILRGIYYTLKQEGKLNQLKGTKLGRFFDSYNCQ
jgi:hypothetical protein